MLTERVCLHSQTLSITLFNNILVPVQVNIDLGQFRVADFKSAVRFTLSRQDYKILLTSGVLHATFYIALPRLTFVSSSFYPPVIFWNAIY